MQINACPSSEPMVDYPSFLSLWREEQSVINSAFRRWSMCKNCIYKVCQLKLTKYINIYKTHATESQVIIATCYTWLCHSYRYKIWIGRGLQSWGCMQFSMSFSKGSMAPCKWIQLSLNVMHTIHLKEIFLLFFIVISKSQVYNMLTIPLSWDSLDDIAKFIRLLYLYPGTAWMI